MSQEQLDELTQDSPNGFTRERAAQIYEESRHWPAEQKVALLRYLNAAVKRREITERYANAAEVAKSVDRDYRVTPAIKVIADAIETVLNYPRCNLLVTMPPQEGKSNLCSVWAPIRALQLNPNRRIILATYGDALAESHSSTCRDIISTHGTDVLDPLTGVNVEDKIGLKLSPKSSKVSAWKVDGAKGGMVAVGLGSAITGRSADLFIIDDPYKNMMEADSASHRRKVDEWMSSVALTRLSPEASMILIQTRWHPEDLSGKVLQGEKELPPEERTWRHINIPAIAEKGIPDALGREPGTVIVSARGRKRAEFEATRKKIGERTWYALYQGSPRIPSGGLFARAWFEPRREFAPTMPIASIVGVDPADSGEGDETGIIAASLDQDGTVVLTEDWSGKFTADEWTRQCVMLAMTVGAREIAMEAYASATTYEAAIKRAWRDIRKEVVEKHTAGSLLTPVEQRFLVSQMPFTVYKWRAKGKGMDAVGRSALFRQALETGKARVVEHKLGVFEDQAADWQAGQHQPDRVAAALIAHDRLAALGTGQMSIATPLNQRPDSSTPAWLRQKIG
ncbi:terminase [Gordonia phage Evaa]|nr:terminase [Gordonia phage Evaa]